MTPSETVACPSCLRTIQIKAGRCPECGVPLELVVGGRKRPSGVEALLKGLAVIGVTLLLLIMACAALLGGSW